MSEHCEFAREIAAITSFWRGMRLSREFRGANRGCIGNVDLREEAVAATRNSLHKAGALCGVAEGLLEHEAGIAACTSRAGFPFPLIWFHSTEDRLASPLSFRQIMRHARCEFR